MIVEKYSTLRMHIGEALVGTADVHDMSAFGGHLINPKSKSRYNVIT